jgi:hypothetical protein
MKISLVLLLASLPFGIRAQVAWPTAQADNARTGANLNETLLTTANLNTTQFGKLFSLAVDANIYAQPLYIPAVSIPGKGVHNVVYVATTNNSVYAFDADSARGPLWKVNFGATFTNNCGTLGGPLGILGTPVIDTVAGLMYVVSMSGPVAGYQLHALDIASGAERLGGPVNIQASVSGTAPDGQNGTVTFDPAQHDQRPGLLLQNGVVYIAFASFCDRAPYHGWVLGYSASTLAQTSVFATTPDGGEGGIWQSGRGLSGDGTSVYLFSGNGDFNVSTGGRNYGESAIRLDASLAAGDWFTPSDWATLNTKDLDFGGCGPLLIPGTGLLVGGGKSGFLFLLKTSALGHLQGSMHIPQSFQVGSPQAPGSFSMGSIAWWNQNLFIWPSGTVLKAYAFNGTKFNTTPITNPKTEKVPGGVLTVSANGAVPSSAILWAVTPDNVFRAYQAANLAELWDSTQNAARDGLGKFARFVGPVVANGKVYVATFSDKLLVYGLLTK